MLLNGIVWAIISDPHKSIDIGELLICGAGRFKRFYCIYIYIYIYIYTVCIIVKFSPRLSIRRDEKKITLNT